MIRVIIFDFDGVVADSNYVKTEAFAELFKNYPSLIREKIKKFHIQNGGMSRFDKFRYIYAKILKENLPNERFDELCADFSRLVIDRVISAPMIDGVEDFLMRNKGRYDMYIVSGTPQDEITAIIKKRGLEIYFSGVYGSPDAKKDIIKRILKENNYNSEEVVFLGDSINDYEGALWSGIQFVAKISGNLDVDTFPNLELKKKVKTIKEFEEYLINKK